MPGSERSMLIKNVALGSDRAPVGEILDIFIEIDR